ncbi:MAG: hypothetical protein KGJ84_13350, partial [Elusimicrobia bacterium]|nr:hypothetical protein [Elusimicrobiota bacterium]
MQINFLAALLSSLILAAPSRAAKVELAEMSASAMAPAAPSISALAISPLSVAAVPSLSVAPSVAPTAAMAAPIALAPAAVPALAAPSAVAAAAAPVSAFTQVRRTAATLAKPETDAASHLDGLYDSAAKAPALEAGADVSAAPASGAPRRRSIGLTKAAAPAIHREYFSPAGAEAKELAKLATSLSENHLPHYKTAVVSQAVDDRRPTVVILSPGSRHKVAIAREGGKQSPGDVHLALDASWLTQVEGPDGKTRLLLKKGVTFDEKGQATLVEYKIPRVVRYFANYFTLGANDRDDG